MVDYTLIIITSLAMAMVGQGVVTMLLIRTIRRLVRDSHPPIDLGPAMVDTLKQLGVICPRPPEGWYCTRPAGHRGACSAHAV